MVGTLHLEALLKKTLVVVGSSVVMTALEFSAYVGHFELCYEFAL